MGPSHLLQATLSEEACCQGMSSASGVFCLQGRSELYLYEVPGLFVASQVLKVVADAGTTVDALNTIKTYISQ